MRFKSSFVTAIAAAAAVVVFTAASQPVEAAIYTWRTAGLGANNNYSTASNWLGGVAAVSATDTTLQFTSNTVGAGPITTNPGSLFNLSQLLLDGTTTYRQGTSLNFADGGAIVNTSSVRQEVLLAKPNGTGFSVTSVSGTLALKMNFTSVGPTVTLGGVGAKELDASPAGNIGAGIVGNGGEVRITGAPVGGANVYGDLTMNAGSLIMASTEPVNVAGVFTAASGVPVSLSPVGNSAGVAATNGVTYGGLALNLDLNSYPDVTTGYSTGDYVSTLFDAGSGGFSGNLGSLASTASSGPYTGLTWSQVGPVWQSSVFNTNQQLEFRPADGSIYVVPEPTQMVFVAGVGAALGMWRMRKLRLNGRGSDANAC